MDTICRNCARPAASIDGKADRNILYVSGQVSTVKGAPAILGKGGGELARARAGRRENVAR